MKSTFLGITAAAIALVALGLAYFLGTHAQQTTNEPSAYLLTTNWTGYLVVGTDETLDAMPLRKPYPKAVPQVEIGLRSDGVIVWRGADALRPITPVNPVPGIPLPFDTLSGPGH